ncbi:hypothetical protein DICSQDRAFT_134003 [Dichomitus squalens LYAD-421 SS1]|uniref:uncharacterized protein n=1 Tax=Dichomitus squalens (strain LYAD-421) TaxID=732165 RepID=UPI0004414F6F|nr:uncharacterized protein DICSQDRAFT_134003 [Dichomitus squalens LYAD-421 SS1]EJF64319.1 hypothetical protein DICSQDRAFT_134003 [Dichomitus squalens LYAD-421 SS1]
MWSLLHGCWARCAIGEARGQVQVAPTGLNYRDVRVALDGRAQTPTGTTLCDSTKE